MTLGYNRPLYLLAFDHRGSFQRDLFDAPRPVRDEIRARIVDAKEVIYEAFVEATERGAPRDAAGILVDEQYGTSVARKAHSAGHVLARRCKREGLSLTSGRSRASTLRTLAKKSLRRPAAAVENLVRCIVLGRGADEAQVLEWLRIAAPVPGFDGFAVGRTLWEEPLRELIAGKTERSEAVHTIADRYLETVNGFIA